MADLGNDCTRNLINHFGGVTISGGVNYIGNLHHRSDGPTEPDDAERVRQLLKAFTFPLQYQRANRISNSFPETYEWAFKPRQDHELEDNRHLDTTQGLRDWLTDQSPLFWIAGKAGAGKSTLMKFLVFKCSSVDFVTNSNGSKPLVLSHSFWKLGDSCQHDFAGCLLTLFHQLFTARPDLILDFGQELADSALSENYDDLKLGLTDLLAAAKQPTYVFIDGLDEYDDPKYPEDELLDYVVELSELEQVKVCLSSRPDVFFADSLKHFTSLKLQDVTYDDMFKTAKGKLSRSARSHRRELHHEGACDQLADKLCKKAEGIFLWLHLALEDVCRGLRRRESFESVHKRVDALEGSLYGLFSRMLTAIHKVDQQNMAQFVKITVEGPSLGSDEYNINGSEWSSHTYSVFNAFSLANPAITDRCFYTIADLSAVNEADISTLSEQLSTFAELLQERSAGLIEVPDLPSLQRRVAGLSCSQMRNREDLPQRPDASGDSIPRRPGRRALVDFWWYYRHCSLRFVHRSVAEFFQNDLLGLTFISDNLDDDFDVIDVHMKTTGLDIKCGAHVIWHQDFDGWNPYAYNLRRWLPFFTAHKRVVLGMWRVLGLTIMKSARDSSCRGLMQGCLSLHRILEESCDFVRRDQERLSNINKLVEPYISIRKQGIAEWISEYLRTVTHWRIAVQSRWLQMMRFDGGSDSFREQCLAFMAPVGFHTMGRRDSIPAAAQGVVDLMLKDYICNEYCLLDWLNPDISHLHNLRGSQALNLEICIWLNSIVNSLASDRMKHADRLLTEIGLQGINELTSKAISAGQAVIFVCYSPLALASWLAPDETSKLQWWLRKRGATYKYYWTFVSLMPQPIPDWRFDLPSFHFRRRLVGLETASDIERVEHFIRSALIPRPDSMDAYRRPIDVPSLLEAHGESPKGLGWKFEMEGARLVIRNTLNRKD